MINTQELKKGDWQDEIYKIYNISAYSLGIVLLLKLSAQRTPPIGKIIESLCRVLAE